MISLPSLASSIQSALGSLVNNVSPSITCLATVTAKGAILGDNWTPVTGDTNTWTPVSANDNTWTELSQGSNTWLRQG